MARLIVNGSTFVLTRVIAWSIVFSSPFLFANEKKSPKKQKKREAAALLVAHSKPIAPRDLVFEERDGVVVFEAEHFVRQTETVKRSWYITSNSETGKQTVEPDGDSDHLAGASEGAYIEVLPDTRRSHDDKLIKGENFSNEPGKMAVLTYRVHFNNPGTYWIWVRAFTTTTEDNGLHIGIDRTWPETAQRWQTVTKNRWHWESRQRTEDVHVGVPGILTLDIQSPGVHEIHVSMREDGIAIDRILLANKKDYKPEGIGPVVHVKKGNLPKSFPVVKEGGESNKLMPGLANQQADKLKNVDQTAQKAGPTFDADADQVAAFDFSFDGQGYYRERERGLAINPDKDKEGRATIAFAQPSGKYDLTLKSVAESDGQSSYTISINGVPIGTKQVAQSPKAFDDDSKFWLVWDDVAIESGDIIEVKSTTHSADGKENSRGRWLGIIFEPANDATRFAIRSSHGASAKSAKSTEANRLPAPSPTATSDATLPGPSSRKPTPDVASQELARAKDQPQSETANAPKKMNFPKHWGNPPDIQTMDFRPLPGGYGMGSSTLANWIQTNLDRDAQNNAAVDPNRPLLTGPREPNGRGQVTVTGDLRTWNKVTLTIDAVFAHELDVDPNPFTDYNFSVTWTHQSGSPSYVTPGYFAADGTAGESGAESGRKWRCHFSPDKAGRWLYTIQFRQGKQAAFGASSQTVAPYEGTVGRILVEASNKAGRDFRNEGRLDYVGARYLQYAGSKRYFLKFGTDSPETLLAYTDFDNTSTLKATKGPLKTYEPHVKDWKPNDPTWKDGKGKGLIGSLNYLAGQGVNSISFLTYNAGGDGDNVWPFTSRDDKLHYDCSKLDQWAIVFDHAIAKGLHLHFKMQENEIDDNRRGDRAIQNGVVKESLDGGLLGIQRKLYCRELVARFGYCLALNWNIGEENTQSTEEILQMSDYIYSIDPYHHPIVLHTFPVQQDKVYRPLIGKVPPLTGLSLQNPWNDVHELTAKWIAESKAVGKPWVVANDEQNSAATGVPADEGYPGSDGTAEMDGKRYSLHDIRQATLWGNLMAGGAGVEYYFGYKLPQNDLVCEDFRSREQSWKYGRIAIDFFQDSQIPFHEMEVNDSLIGSDGTSNDAYCFAKPGEIYLVYIANGKVPKLDLSGAAGKQFSIQWFNPRTGGEAVKGSPATITGGGEVELGLPPSDLNEDWLAIIR